MWHRSTKLRRALGGTGQWTAPRSTSPLLSMGGRRPPESRPFRAHPREPPVRPQLAATANQIRRSARCLPTFRDVSDLDFWHDAAQLRERAMFQIRNAATGKGALLWPVARGCLRGLARRLRRINCRAFISTCPSLYLTERERQRRRHRERRGADSRRRRADCNQHPRARPLRIGRVVRHDVQPHELVLGRDTIAVGV